MTLDMVPSALLSLALIFVQIMLLYTHHLNSAKLSIAPFLVKFSAYVYLSVNSAYRINQLGIFKALLGGFIAILVQRDHSNSKHFITLPGSNGLNFEWFCNLNAAIYSAKKECSTVFEMCIYTCISQDCTCISQDCKLN